MNTPNETKAQIINIKALYVKNSGYETTNTPMVFKETAQAQEGQIELRVTNTKVEEDNLYEAVLSLTVKAQPKDQSKPPLFTVKVEQAGLFQIENFDTEQLQYVLDVYCPNILYPYARCVISQLISLGNFPSMLLQPINFDLLYRDKMKNNQQQ